MNLKNITFLLIFYFLSACGYQALNLQKNLNYSILNYNLKGDNQVNKILARNFEKYKNLNNINSIEILSNTKVNKSESVRDTSGKAISYNLNIIIDITVIKNGIEITKKLFNKKTNYDNLASQFELKQYEKILINDLVEQMINDINYFLSNI